MVAFQIEEIGSVLNQMLTGTMFDTFLLKEATISQGWDTHIDGAIKEDFYSEEEKQQLQLEGLRFIPFSFVRPFCLNLMKGNRMPDAFRFVFLHSPKNQASTISHAGSHFSPEDITGLFLHLTYKNGTLTCTTGVSYRVFSMDKSLEQEWDRLVALFFKQHGIAVIPL